jgi:putative MATE family efflux protein
MQASSQNFEVRQQELLRLSGAMLVEMMLHNLAGMLSLWLVSRISDDMTAIFFVVNQIVFSFVILFRIVSMGAGVVVAQHLGALDEAGAQRVAKAALASSAWMGLICAALLALGAPQLLTWMQMPPHLAAQATPYLQVMAVALFFDAGNFIFTTVLRSYKFSQPTMLLAVGTQVVSLAIAVPLMHGLWGMPALGLWGLIIGAVLSRALAWLIGFGLWQRLTQTRMPGRDWWLWQADAMKAILRIGLPGAGEHIAYRISFMLITAMIAGMGAQALATYSYAFQIMVFILLFSLVLGLGTEIVVSHCVGAGQLHEANRIVVWALRLGFAVSLGLSILVAWAGPWLLALFTQDQQIIALGSKLLWLCLLLETGRSMNLIVINGLRATGDVRFPLAAGVFSMFMVAAGVAWLLGVHWAWGLTGVWIAFALDEWVRGLMMFARWRSRAWLKTARNSHRTIRRQKQLHSLA